MSNVILVRGKPGVGKTTISNELSNRINVNVLRKDTIYDTLSTLGLGHQKTNSISEELLLEMIIVNIKNGVDVIVDNSYHYQNHYEGFRDWVEAQEVSLKSILVSCSDEALWKKRFEKRKESPKPNNIIVDFEELKNHYGSLETLSYKGELILDNVTDIETLAANLVNWLDEPLNH